MSEAAYYRCEQGHGEVLFRAGQVCLVCAARQDRDGLLMEIGRLRKELADAQARPREKAWLESGDIQEFLNCSARTLRRYRELGFLPAQSLTSREQVLAAVPRINAVRKNRNLVRMAA